MGERPLRRTDETRCASCGHVFEPPPESIGGIVNCPGCGRAVEVGGLDDPFWRLLQVGAVLLVLAVGVVVGAAVGPVPGLVVGAALLAGLWLLSRAL